MELHALNQVLRESALFVNRLFTANRIASSLQALKKQAKRKGGDFILINGLLFKNGRLIMLINSTDKALIADLIYKDYNQIFFAYFK